MLWETDLTFEDSSFLIVRWRAHQKQDKSLWHIQFKKSVIYSSSYVHTGHCNTKTEEFGCRLIHSVEAKTAPFLLQGNGRKTTPRATAAFVFRNMNSAIQGHCFASYLQVKFASSKKNIYIYIVVRNTHLPNRGGSTDSTQMLFTPKQWFSITQQVRLLPNAGQSEKLHSNL